MRDLALDNLNKGRRLEGVQLLRGAAALGVVLTHVVTRAILYQHDAFRESFFRLKDGDQWKGGDIGVDIFFVISGFIIMIVHRNDLGKPRAYIDFLAKRIKRVVPLYWTLTTVAVILFILAPQIAANSKTGINVFWVLCSYLFIPTSLSGQNNSPVVGVGWTLDYEMLFYAVFAILMRFNRRVFVVSITVIFSTMVLVGSIIQPENLYARFLSDWLLMDFVGGVWIAYLMLNAGRVSTSISVWIILLSVSIIILTFSISVPEVGPMRLVFWGLPSILLVQGMINFRIQDGVFRNIVLTLGSASYSIYLSQVFTIPLWTSVVLKTKISSSIDMQIVMIFVMTSVSGVIVWYFVERRINKHFNSIVERSREKIVQ